jgi:hypothetical protein
MSEVREFRDRGSSMVFDDTFFPVIIRTYSGVTTERLVRETIAWLGEYLTKLPKQPKVVLISDTREVPSTDPKGRKFAAESSKTLEPHMRAHNVDAIVILTNPVLRGAIRAICWISDLKLMPAKDLGDALRLAAESLAKVGRTLPFGLTPAYRAPKASGKQP